MTLPQVVQENVGWLDSRGRDDAWTSVRAHLMSQEEVIRAKDAQLELANAKVLVAESRVTDASAELHRLTEIAEDNARLEAASKQHFTQAMENGQAARIAEAKLEAANALLRECHCYFEARGVDSRTIGEPLSLNEKIQSHLQGAGDEA